MLAVALSVISAVALSLVTAVATGAIRKGFYKIRSGIDSLRSLGYDVRQDELYCLGDWSPARKLQPSRLITETTLEKNRPKQPYIDRRALANAVRKRSRKASGATLYMTGFRIDRRESDETQYCRVRLAAHSGYEHAAIDWIPLRQPLVRSFIRPKRRTYPDKIGSTIKVKNRVWLEQSRLGVLEAWRFRNSLDD